MAQDSIAYGESLLSGIRERNDKIARQNKKEAKRDKWKALGMQAAIGVAESALKSKHEKFLNSEAALARQTGMNKAITNGQTTLNDLETIKSYAGGQDQYVMDTYTAPLIKQYMQKQYTDGTYSTAHFNAVSKKLADLYNPTMVAAFNKEASATKTFFENNDVDLYNSNREKLAGAKTVEDGFINLVKGLPVIKSLTGDIDRDTVRANQEAYRLAAVGDKDVQGSYEKSLKGFQEVFDKTQSSGLADFVMQNIKDSEGAVIQLNKPPLEYTHETKEKDIYSALSGEVVGKETYVVQTGVNSITGQVESVEEINADGSVKTKSNTNSRNYNDEVAAILKGDTKDAATVFINNQSDEDIKLINDKIVRQLDATDTSKMSNEAMSTFGKNKSDILSAQVFHGGYIAQQQKIGTVNTGRHIAFELSLMNAELTENQTMKTNVGAGNIFNTLKAYNNALDKGKVAKDTVFGIINFIEQNPDAIRLEYDRLSDTEKARLVTEMGEGKGKTAYVFGEEIKGYNYFQSLYPEKSASNPEPEKKNTFRILFQAIKEANRTGGELVLNFN